MIDLIWEIVIVCMSAPEFKYHTANARHKHKDKYAWMGNFSALRHSLVQVMENKTSSLAMFTISQTLVKRYKTTLKKTSLPECRRSWIACAPASRWSRPSSYGGLRWRSSFRIVPGRSVGAPCPGRRTSSPSRRTRAWPRQKRENIGWDSIWLVWERRRNVDSFCT